MASNKLTIIQAAIQAIREIGRPASSVEIFEHIVRENLYVFKAKDPQSVLKSALRRHRLTPKGKTTVLVKEVENNKYQIL
jgi:hypothetical protein